MERKRFEMFKVNPSAFLSLCKVNELILINASCHGLALEKLSVIFQRVT